MFKNLKIGVRLGLGFGFVLILLTFISVLAYARLSVLASSIDGVVNDKFPKTVIANEIVDQINVIARALRNSVLARQADVVKKELDRVEEARKIISGELGKLEKSITSDEGKRY